MTRPQDEVANWRRVRKALANALAERCSGTTVRELLPELTEIETLAQEREKAWIALIQAKEDVR